VHHLFTEGVGVTLALFENPDPRPPWQRPTIRPPRYVVVSRYDLDDDFWQEDIKPDFTDTQHGYLCTHNSAPQSADDDDACWDNWVGEWVKATDWSDQVDICAEGFARYDLRPEGHTA
jgi:hypothetical protein